MFEKCNPAHVDKIADRIAGAIVDLAYSKNDNPTVACEVLIGYNTCRIINETNTHITEKEINDIVKRITFNPHLKKQLDIKVDYIEVKQDVELAKNQSKEIRCGDNGIFKGLPITSEEKYLTKIVKTIYDYCETDGKYILDGHTLIVCQSYLNDKDSKLLNDICSLNNLTTTINPLGNWTGGINVDTGATNRKLGSDMGDAVTGGGLHGKDLSKADVSVNIFCHLLAQKEQREIKACCAIGDEEVNMDGELIPYSEIVEEARKYIQSIGGFERLAEWGLIR